LRRDGDVAHVVMARPEQRNAFNQAMIAELTRAFNDLGGETEVRVIVLSGEGSVFSGGADVRYMRKVGAFDHDENVADGHRMATLFLSIRDCPKPVVARVQGAAMGGGAGMVAASDIAVAAADAKFAFSEARLGIMPAVISPFVVPRIGAGAARELFLTGEVFGAERAREIGLVSHVGPEADLDDIVAERVQALRAAGPEAQAGIKRLLPSIVGLEAGTHELTARLTAERRGSDEGREGLSSFLERRRPSWNPRRSPSQPEGSESA
jgi:methylglutaconyl-CoA hydratase